ncbi:uncharacterized protein DNG_09337 [Cephalotrichum gorgonifer]|uniref:Uncharacterized protein n=1 Tax=Cephalotrichum gorgonifer TaxID=2041049 RepID=A0AAE8SZ70_9PEZI|nr:uncharacterized protein DNG_09337 [Cephalotrichum gorgonifer]
MAVFVDLEVEDHHDDTNGHWQLEKEDKPPQRKQPGSSESSGASSKVATVYVSPANGTLQRALCIYPIAVGIAQHIDIVSLDSLARTCRAAHAGLIQYRKALLASTLRCHQDTLPVPDPEDTFRYRARAGNWFLQNRQNLQNFNGKTGRCARDMVSECRRCSEVICRNCATKQPEPRALKERYRRLCVTCAHSPLKDHINPLLDPDTPISSSVIQQGVCHCETSGVWLCQPCGRSMRNQDQTYLRVWRWRSRYVLERSIPCGREADCLNAVEKEVEMDSAGERTPSVAGASSSLQHPAPLPPPSLSEADGSLHRPGYNIHEYEGSNGRVTNKTVVRVKVGRSVPEWHDERDVAQVLSREVEGKVRAWCGWCWRAIPGREET